MTLGQKTKRWWYAVEKDVNNWYEFSRKFLERFWSEDIQDQVLQNVQNVELVLRDATSVRILLIPGHGSSTMAAASRASCEDHVYRTTAGSERRKSMSPSKSETNFRGIFNRCSSGISSSQRMRPFPWRRGMM
ncbi:unnamed protein product [Nesidiocoris tenuis]|uniref:Uncharacterized protein n=1 Tax=Nesidiocoris tenuis TaxID=355587 RepID=A0A6H5HRX0_9HEMI|nr:unnamed protein product [Nesidiocoris tenuis]